MAKIVIIFILKSIFIISVNQRKYEKDARFIQNEATAVLYNYNY